MSIQILFLHLYQQFKNQSKMREENLNNEPNSALHKTDFSCRLFDLMALNPNEFHEYKEPIYTKIGGMYGYLSVSMFNVHFFWYDGSNVCFDDVSDKFRIEYISLNGN